jgi:hypothetical protein
MSRSDATDSHRTFVVVMRASSAAMLDDGAHIEIPISSPLGTVNATFRTRYVDEGFKAKVPRDLWIEVRGPATSLDEAVIGFSGLGSSLVTLIALAANAAVRELALHLAFEDTLGAGEREFLQAYLPDETGVPCVMRPVPLEATLALFGAISDHSEQKRLIRAACQYHSALMHWKLGQEVMALAHLYMGMEALTKAALRAECASRGVNEDQLVSTLRIEKKHLDSWVRRTILFQGDKDCADKAKKASDGFEHGFLDFGNVRALAATVLVKTAKYLRCAILDMAAGKDEKIAPLRTGQYLNPLGAWEFVKYCRGTLVGHTSHLAPAGEEYPHAIWRSRIKDCWQDEKKHYQVTPEEKLTWRLGKGVTVKVAGVEVWGAMPNQGEPADPTPKE